MLPTTCAPLQHCAGSPVRHHPSEDTAIPPCAATTTSCSLQADALEHALLAALPLGPQGAAGGVSLPDMFTGELSVRRCDAAAFCFVLASAQCGYRMPRRAAVGEAL